MALVKRQHCVALLSPSKLSSPRSNHRFTDSSACSLSSNSSASSSGSNYSFDSASSEKTSPSSHAFSSSCFGPSKTRTSCLSEFCSDCRRTHIRRKSTKTRVVVRPLPPTPPPTPRVRPLPRPTTVRKLPSLPPSRSQQSQQQPKPLPQHEPTRAETNPPVSQKKPQPVTYEYFAPEIDWDAIMVEIVRGGSGNCETSDADSIYTDFAYDDEY